MNIVDKIKQRLLILEPQYLQLQDDSHLHVGHTGNSNHGRHYTLTLVSAQFIGQTRLNRQRMIKTALADLFNHDIHALSIKAMAPDEFESDV